MIPAYNCCNHIHHAISSVIDGAGEEWNNFVEILVVDDGSTDGIDIGALINRYPGLVGLQHSSNRGMCAARNTGIAHSRREYVTLLDADDVFVENWLDAFIRITEDWREDVRVCLTPCVISGRGMSVSGRPFSGYYDAEAYAIEKYRGEYNPVFLGDYIRERLYTDLGCKKSCGTLSYLRLVREAPFWVSSQVMREYRYSSPCSVSTNWAKQEKAKESLLCCESIIRAHGEFIRSVSVNAFEKLLFKTELYRLLAGRGGVTRILKQRQLSSWRWWLMIAFSLLGRSCTAAAVQLVKRSGLIHRYG